MGVVWLGRDELLGRDVAVKFMLGATAGDDDPHFVTFLEGARAAAALRSPGITAVHHADVVAGAPYIVMEYVDGPSLARVIRASGTLTFPAAWHVIRSLTATVAQLHDAGIIHRDIKPSNVLFRSLASHQRKGAALGDEQMLLGDFGLARSVGEGLTLAAGTPQYMAPEQARSGSDLDHRADVFGAAAVLFEMLAGSPPSTATTLAMVTSSTEPQQAANRLATLRSEVAPALIEVVRTGLATDPADRFGSISEMSAAIRAAVSKSSLVTPTIIDAEPPHLPSNSTEASVAIAELVDWIYQRVVDRRARSLLRAARQRLADPWRLLVVDGGDGRGIGLALEIAGVALEDPSVLGSVESVWLQRAERGELRARDDDGVHDVAFELDGSGSLRFSLSRPTERLTLRLPRPTLSRHAILAAGPDHLGDCVPEADLALVLLPADPSKAAELLTAVRSAGARSVTGPVRVVGLARDDATADALLAEPSIRLHLAEVLPLEESALAAVAGAVGPVEAVAGPLRLTGALALVTEAAKASDPGLRRTRRPLLERIDAMKLEAPVLAELDVLRSEVAGRLVLPLSMRDEMRRLLIEHDPDARLGLAPGSSHAERAAAALDGLERWRAFVNTGRAAFGTRDAATVVARAYDRLFSGSA